MEIDRYKDGSGALYVIEAGSRRDCAAEVLRVRREGWHRVGRMAVYHGGVILPEDPKRYVQMMERSVLSE